MAVWGEVLKNTAPRLLCHSCNWLGPEDATNKTDVKDTLYYVVHCPVCRGTWFTGLGDWRA